MTFTNPTTWHASVLATALLTLATLNANAREQAEAPASLEAVLNYHRVNDSLVTAGQISAVHAPMLKADGVELVINLAVADPERNRDEAFTIAEAGMVYMNIPVVWDNPTQADLDLFLDVMDAAKHKHVLVHCFANYRASAFTYLHRVLRAGVAPEVARKDLETVWTDEAWTEYPQWRELIDRALQP